MFYIFFVIRIPFRNINYSSYDNKDDPFSEPLSLSLNEKKSFKSLNEREMLYLMDLRLVFMSEDSKVRLFEIRISHGDGFIASPTT